MTENNIYPIFDRMLSRQDKEELLKQHSVMIWFTGLSGSGKSTIAIALERELHKRGLLCRILDGDNIRNLIKIFHPDNLFGDGELAGQINKEYLKRKQEERFW